MIIGYIDN